MKKSVYIFAAVLIAGLFTLQPLSAQNTLSKKEERKLERQKKKAAKDKKAMDMRKTYDALLRNKHFVFEAQKVFLPGGPYTTLDYSLNFLAVKGDKILIQLHFPGLTGSNGLGGFTARGKLENWQYNPGKNIKQPMTASGQVTPKGSGSRLVFTLFVNNDGSAELQVNLPNSSFRLTGNLVSIEQSNVLVGASAF